MYFDLLVDDYTRHLDILHLQCLLVQNAYSVKVKLVTTKSFQSR